MNHFLSSLLDRALGRAPTLQRRRPSVFEPVAPSRAAASWIDEGSGQDDSLVEGTTRDTRRTPAPHAGQLDYQPPRPAEISSPRAFPRQDAAPSRAPIVHPEVHLSREDPPSPERREQVREPEIRPSPADAPMRPGSLKTVIHTRETSREITSPALHTEGRETRRLPAEAAATPLRARTTAVVAPAPPASKAMTVPASAPALSPRLRPMPQPTGPALLAKAHLPPMRRTAAEAAPVRRAAQGPQLPPPRPAPDAPVSVTIGSIEIRSAQPPAPAPPKARPAGPKLILDDYLAARHGGGR